MSRAITSSKEPKKKTRPAATPEARENRLISLAEDLAEKQLVNGTASPSVVVHYLKLGTVKAQMELESMKLEQEVLKAKADALVSQKKSEELFDNAIKAMRGYVSSGRMENDAIEEF